MKQTLYIIRGLPGTGKSTLAKKLAKSEKIEYFEADMYFIDPKTGEYKWNAQDIGAAHEWCFREVEDELFNGKSVIVSNTFVELRTMEQYFVLGERLECRIMVIECLNNYGNIHNVPEETLEKMKRRWISNDHILMPSQKHELLKKNEEKYFFVTLDAKKPDYVQD